GTVLVGEGVGVFVVVVCDCAARIKNVPTKTKAIKKAIR
ncbi:MAG: hypothetical protein US11_C0002G0001, partial [Candidatus Roizmanbacteria bacterium GW2011_GWA2_36_23]